MNAQGGVGGQPEDEIHARGPAKVEHVRCCRVAVGSDQNLHAEPVGPDQAVLGW